MYMVKARTLEAMLSHVVSEEGVEKGGGHGGAMPSKPCPPPPRPSDVMV